MLPQLAKIKGVHPGLILRRELNLQARKGNDLAIQIGEHKQTISAILNKRRSINPKLSIKLANQFNVDEDYFMLLQSSYDVKIASKSLMISTPNIGSFRKILFWDTTLDKIDWDKNKRAVITRVLERGNKIEMNEIISFYGREIIKTEIKHINTSRLPSFEVNIKQYNLI